MPAEELLFEPTPGFGEYRPFLEHAIAHPAKANTKLLEFLIEEHTQPGDTVLDPMAGSGSTLVVAALKGRNAIGVELEQKFYEWMEKSRINVEKHHALTSKGWIRSICGDARRLSELLIQSDVILTSPPYSETLQQDHDYQKEYGFPRATGKPIGIGRSQAHTIYSGNPENIGNLSHGDVEAVLTSPPYAASVNAFNDPARRAERLRKARLNPKMYVGGNARDGQIDWKYGESEGQIGNLPLGSIDTIVTSPPYGDSKRGETEGERFADAMETHGSSEESRRERHTPGRLRAAKAMVSGYSKSKENIGNLPFVYTVVGTLPYKTEMRNKGLRLVCKWNGHSENPENTDNKLDGSVDAIVTSPPYEASLEGTSRHTRGGIASRDSALAQTGSYATVMSFGVPVGYSPNRENIGNLKKETYLEAMLRVYREMWLVLKLGGSAIIILKAFVRNKKVEDLPYHTWLLLQRVGFRLTKLYKLRLKQQSFWRILYYQKHPDVPRISHEYVLVCVKANGQNAKV